MTENECIASPETLRNQWASMKRPFVHDHVAFNVAVEDYLQVAKCLRRRGIDSWDADHGLQQVRHLAVYDGSRSPSETGAETRTN